MKVERPVDAKKPVEVQKPKVAPCPTQPKTQKKEVDVASPLIKPEIPTVKKENPKVKAEPGTPPGKSSRREENLRKRIAACISLLK